MSPRDTLRSAAPSLLPTIAVGFPMSPRRARWLAAVLEERGIAAYAARVDGEARSVVRVAPGELRRAEAIALGFREGIRCCNAEGWYLSRVDT